MKLDGEPLWIEVPDDEDLKADGVRPEDLKKGGNYKFCLKNELQGNEKSIKICFVLIRRSEDHPYIKKFLDNMGVKSQFMLENNIKRKVEVMGVMSNLLRQVNAKCGLDLYRMNLVQKVKNTPTMFVGMDVINMGRDCVIGLTASYNQHYMQYFNDAVHQKLYKDQIG
jgi:hypothetical protein